MINRKDKSVWYIRIFLCLNPPVIGKKKFFEFLTKGYQLMNNKHEISRRWETRKKSLRRRNGGRDLAIEAFELMTFYHWDEQVKLEYNVHGLSYIYVLCLMFQLGMVSATKETQYTHGMLQQVLVNGITYLNFKNA